MTVLLIALAGALGALARYLLDALIARHRSGTFPLATLTINVSGSLLLGVVTGLVLFRGRPDDLRLVIGTGFCGGYTTFSTASFEIVRLVQRSRVVRACGYLLATVVLTLGAAALGLLVTY